MIKAPSLLTISLSALAVAGAMAALGPSQAAAEILAHGRPKWYATEPEFDREIRERFGEDLALGISGTLDSWKSRTWVCRWFGRRPKWARRWRWSHSMCRRCWASRSTKV